MHDLISENDQSESAWLSDLIKNVKDRKDQFKSEEKPFSPRTAPDLFQLSSVHELWDNKEFIKELFWVESKYIPLSASGIQYCCFVSLRFYRIYTHGLSIL